jgi:hypothetical protein
MTDFSVQPNELRALGRTLGGVHGRLVHLTGKMSSLGGSVTGHDRLAAALEGFAEEWTFSLGKIKEHAEAVEAMVIQAANAYDEVDTEVARAARG